MHNTDCNKQSLLDNGGSQLSKNEIVGRDGNVYRVNQNGSAERIREATPDEERISGATIRERQRFTETPEVARNRALEEIGDINPSTREPFVARRVGEGNILTGNTVGFTARRTDRIRVVFRVDFDPDKGPHINIEIGKGANRQKTAFRFPGTAEDALAYIRGNFDQ